MSFLYQFNTFLFISLFQFATLTSFAKDSAFSFTLFKEPHTLNPNHHESFHGDYFLPQIMSGLYKIENESSLVEDGGSCFWKTSIILKCKIFSSHKWENGEAIKAQDYFRSFQRLINPKIISPKQKLVESILNFKKIISGQTNLSKKEFKIISDSEFEIFFKVPDFDFLYKLAQPSLAPTHESEITDVNEYKKYVSSGPYKFKNWIKNEKIELTPNLNYHKKNKRPDLNIYFVSDDKAAYRLYSAKKISFLRRLTSDLIEKHKTNHDFHQIPVSRFDYVGFSNKIRESKLNQSLATSINFDDFKKMFHALGPPGCPSIPDLWQKNIYCQKYNPKNKKIEFTDKVTFAVSKLGGDDIIKIAEFFQSEWKKNINFEVEIQIVEQTTYLKNLRENRYDIFRKGVGLDIPTCFEALKDFSSYGNNNYTQFSNPEFNNYVTLLLRTKDLEKRKLICSKALKILITQFIIIPMGKMHFSILADPQFKNWKLNSLNQLDLSGLEFSNKN